MIWQAWVFALIVFWLFFVTAAGAYWVGLPPLTPHSDKWPAYLLALCWSSAMTAVTVLSGLAFLRE